MPPLRPVPSGTGRNGGKGRLWRVRGSRGRRGSVVGVAPSSAIAIGHRPQTVARGRCLGVTGVTLRPVEGCSGSYTLRTKQPQPDPISRGVSVAFGWGVNFVTPRYERQQLAAARTGVVNAQ